MGAFGVVVEHPDGSLTKFLIEGENDSQKQENRQLLENEIGVLGRLRAHLPREIAIPRILKEPEFLGHQKYMAAYTMTKVPGTAGQWYPEQETRDAVTLEKTFENAGKALAVFHRAAAKIPLESMPVVRRCVSRIEQQAGLGVEENAALAAADRYLTAHKKTGIVHGDYHGANMMVNARNEVTGMIDFSMTGVSGNHLLDFIGVPEKSMSPFVRGYERESGEKIDMNMVTLTSLALFTDRYSRLPPQIDEEKVLMKKVVDRHLRGLVPITGYTPP